MGVRRADESAPRLARVAFVVRETTATGQKARVLDARQRSPDVLQISTVVAS
jgi:hypothetical protein